MTRQIEFYALKNLQGKVVITCILIIVFDKNSIANPFSYCCMHQIDNIYIRIA